LLSRELCEALAEALGEVRDHKPEEGDWYYLREQAEDDDPVLCIGVDRGAALYRVNEWIGCEPDTLSRDDVWCPRLDQLLELAQAMAGPHIEDNRLLLFRPAHAEWTYATYEHYIECADPDHRGMSDPNGKTPEEAIARWLLMNTRKEATDRADPSDSG